MKLGDWLEEANIGARLAADRLRPRDDARRPHHAGGDRQVGDPRPDLHPALPAARRRAADGARGLPRRRLAGQRDHAADGLLPAHRHLHAAVPQGRGHRHGRLDDAAVRPRPDGRLDAVLRRLVPPRDPARPGSPVHIAERARSRHGSREPTAADERHDDHLPRPRGGRRRLRLGPASRSGSSRSGSRSRSGRRASSTSTRRSPASATRPSSSSRRSSSSARASTRRA